MNEPQPGDLITVEPPVGSIVRDEHGKRWQNTGSNPELPWRSWSGLYGNWRAVLMHGSPLTLVRWGSAQ